MAHRWHVAPRRLWRPVCRGVSAVPALLLGAACALALGGGTPPPAFFALPTPPWDNSQQKERLLSLIDGTQRGAAEPDGRREEIVEAFEALERSNPNVAPLQSPQLRADWELLWTSSPSILGLNRPFFLRPKEDKPILQFLDPFQGVARNLEDTPVGRNTVDAEIAPLNPENLAKFTSKLDNYLFFKYGEEEQRGGTYLPETTASLMRTTVGVRFRTFNVLGLLSIPAPEQATGILEITYLDDTMRLSRGDRGNLFVLRRFADEPTA